MSLPLETRLEHLFLFTSQKCMEPQKEKEFYYNVAHVYALDFLKNLDGGGFLLCNCSMHNLHYGYNQSLSLTLQSIERADHPYGYSYFTNGYECNPKSLMLQVLDVFKKLKLYLIVDLSDFRLRSQLKEKTQENSKKESLMVKMVDHQSCDEPPRAPSELSRRFHVEYPCNGPSGRPSRLRRIANLAVGLKQNIGFQNSQ